MTTHHCCNNASSTKSNAFSKLVFNWFLIALGVVLAAHTCEGIAYTSWSALLTAVIVMSLFNMLLKPILVFFTLPFVILSMGLGLWVINAGLLLLASKMVNGFYVASFSSALWGALMVSLISFVVNVLWSPKVRTAWQNRGSCSKAKVIDKTDAQDI